jgi:hypothetical protein
MEEGRFTIPTRIFLTASQRDRLTALLLEQQVDLSELLTELLGSFLDHLPESAPADEVAAADDSERETELRQRRAEVRRLRARILTQGSAAPAWIIAYVCDLEREIARLEQELS